MFLILVKLSVGKVYSDQGWFEVRAIGGGVTTVLTDSDQVGHLRPTWSFKTNLFILDQLC